VVAPIDRKQHTIWKVVMAIAVSMFYNHSSITAQQSLSFRIHFVLFSLDII
jgi:hypothetical protein